MANTNTTVDTTFTGIDPEALPEDLKPIYKSMLSDYTKKTQELAERTRSLEAGEGQRSTDLKKLGALEEEVTNWRTWFANLEQQVTDDGGTSAGAGGEGGLTDDFLKGALTDASSKDGLSAVGRQLTEIQSKIASLEATFGDSKQSTDKMFGYHNELNRLMLVDERLRNKETQDELFNHAIRHGFSSLEKAYSDLHREELLDKEVTKRVEERLAELKTAGVHTGRSVQRSGVIKSRTEGPLRSFTDATDDILSRMAQDGTLD